MVYTSGMEKAASLRIGSWRVDPAAGEIAREAATGRLEPVRLDTRAMRLLLCLAELPGELVSIDELLTQVWPEVTVSQDSVYQAVASLRRVLGDDPKQPAYIATVPRLGYRMVAPVSEWVAAPVDTAVRASDGAGAGPGWSRRVAWAVGAVVCLSLAAALLFHGKGASGSLAATHVVPAISQKSIAVLPFLDLTHEMSEEPFADGMTEELIDKLSRIPGLRVPSPTSSFFFKGKQIPVADIARSLGVAYVVDGSVRKSGDRVRVAARLVRAETGFVVWSETYDRPFHDRLMLQDDIAGEVAKALGQAQEFGAR